MELEDAMILLKDDKKHTTAKCHRPSHIKNERVRAVLCIVSTFLSKHAINLILCA